MHLIQLLRQQGYRPGVVSRGHGGDNKYCREVTEHSDPRLVGDEPLLIVKRTGCPMVIGRDRPAAMQTLLADYACDIIISDDGLQHYPLQRDIEIVVIDGERRFGNELCLPAGPLREPISRLAECDFIVNNGQSAPG
jgi:tetraacyldisaccharide 4'-kinase